ncbi:hypothetical protein VT84_27325 [Gemmata sp. SH-PL17]|uniref:hypothetical protein n=1 Tax=Gemmata sp. SH-PL17 TaxID=1630693 RepID=UPI00078C9C65|nr:hypothetical protein [Gemmata sp. SH-PL17]AMV28148.1 hypothetical protein VT84_27325 [Gemmata sp. SH-PL17]
MECILALFLIVGTFMAAAVVVEIFFLLTLSKAIGECHPRNRTMEPGMVWLNLIPIFNLAWKLVTVIRVSETLEREYRYRGWHRRDETYGYGVGLASCIAMFLFMGLPHLVLKIMYWVKIAEFNKQLTGQDPPPREDEDDDRPVRRRRPRADDRDDYDDRSDNRRRRDDRFDEDDRPTRRRDEHDDYHDDRGDDRKPWDRDGR